MIIVIEGTDQAGKYTQTRLLKNELDRYCKTTIFDFPDYTTLIGKEIRKYLDGKRNFTPQVIHCLLSANRWEKLEEIKSANNDIVIMNRYYHSNIVYGLANNLEYSWLENLDKGLPKPDIVFLLDIPQHESFKRQYKDRDKFESDIKFLTKISNIYLKIAKKQHWKIIDATKSKDEIHKLVLKELKKEFKDII